MSRTKNIAIKYRPNSPEASGKAKAVAQWLGKLGHKVWAFAEQDLGKSAAKLSPKHLKCIDLVVVLGGDGTYLQAIQPFAERAVPTLGVNMGSLGFLTINRVEDLEDKITAALNGKLEARARAVLKVEVFRKKKLHAQFTALNDAVIERGSVTHLINFRIQSGKDPVADIKADALIIATPTGSTAYNLAAGGPILHPEVRAVVVTPVCPHALTSRPLIFPDDQKISFHNLSPDRKAVLTVDGVSCGEISKDDEVRVVRHSLDHLMLREPNHNFFALLREKLKFGERA